MENSSTSSSGSKVKADMIYISMDGVVISTPFPKRRPVWIKVDVVSNGHHHLVVD
jgi:hypothetical protein